MKFRILLKSLVKGLLATGNFRYVEVFRDPDVDGLVVETDLGKAVVTANDLRILREENPNVEKLKKALVEKVLKDLKINENKS